MKARHLFLTVTGILLLLNCVCSQSIKESILEGNLSQVVEFLETGQSLSVKDSRGRTLLYDSIESGYVSILEALLERGADPNVKDNNGITPMALALNKGYPIIILCLRLNQAKLNSAEEIITFIQNVLWLRGYQIQSFAGSLDENTKKAIKKYQTESGLPIDGQATITLVNEIVKYNNLEPFINAEGETISNIYISKFDLSSKNNWNKGGFLGSMAKPKSLTDHSTGGWDVNGLFKMQGHFAFGNFEINGGFWLRNSGFIIEHGSQVKIR